MLFATFSGERDSVGTGSPLDGLSVMLRTMSSCLVADNLLTMATGHGFRFSVQRMSR